VYELLITFSCSVGIFEVAAGFCFFASCSRVSIVGEIDKFDDFISMVFFTHLEDIDIRLYTRLADKYIYRHLDAGDECMFLEDSFVIFSGFA
jgi:hypothetical protein